MRALTAVTSPLKSKKHFPSPLQKSPDCPNPLDFIYILEKMIYVDKKGEAAMAGAFWSGGAWRADKC